MNLEPVDVCPVTGRRGVVRYPSVRDYSFGAEGNWSISADAGSGHLWLSPRPSDADISSLYENYYTHGGQDKETSIWAKAIAIARSRRLGYPPPRDAGLAAQIVARMPTVSDSGAMDALKIFAHEQGRLLDLGCGSGSFMARMQKWGWDVVGIEPDPKAVAHLKGKYNFDIRTSLIGCDDLAGSFDLITMNHLIEHLPDPLQTLKQCRKLLRPNGRVIVVTPNARSLGLYIFGQFWRGLEAPRHFHVFTATSLRDTFKAAGFEVDTLTTEGRMARGIFTVSLQAARGRQRIEVEPTFRASEKLAGYFFHLIEGLLLKIYPQLGEELYCVAALAPK